MNTNTYFIKKVKQIQLLDSSVADPNELNSYPERVEHFAYADPDPELTIVSL